MKPLSPVQNLVLKAFRKSDKMPSLCTFAELEELNPRTRNADFEDSWAFCKDPNSHWTGRRAEEAHVLGLEFEEDFPVWKLWKTCKVQVHPEAP